MHQELQLVPALTVAQNVFPGIEARTFGVLHRTESARLTGLMQSSGFAPDPDAIIATLSIANRQKAEILRALARDEVEKLHQTMRADGRTVIHVSHFLDDILSVSDRVTLLGTVILC